MACRKAFSLLLAAVVILVLAAPAGSQLMRWCPAGDGSLAADGPPGNNTVDLNYDGEVGVADFAIFGTWYGGGSGDPPLPHSKCYDWVYPFDVINAGDFAFFGFHYYHSGPVTGFCN